MNGRSFGKKIPPSEQNKITHSNQKSILSNKININFISTKTNKKLDEHNNNTIKQKSFILKTNFNKNIYLNKSHENKIINNFVENQI